MALPIIGLIIPSGMTFIEILRLLAIPVGIAADRALFYSGYIRCKACCDARALGRRLEGSGCSIPLKVRFRASPRFPVTIFAILFRKGWEQA